MAAFRELNLTVFLIDQVIAFHQRRIFGILTRLLQFQARRELVHFLVQLRVFFRRAGDDQRGARLIDQDGVHLIDDRVGQVALKFIFERKCHVVA